jgi:hypothetical protein
MGSLWTWIRTRWAMAMSNGRGIKLFTSLAIILLVVLPIAIFLPDKGGDSTSALLDSKRYETISNRIVSSGLTPLEILTKENSPYNQALNWIVAEDPSQLDPEDKFLLSRYSLAVLYFATHGENMYQTATINITEIAPNETTKTDQQSTSLLRKDETFTIGDDLAAQPYWVSETGWLSGQGYCSWYGIECHHREGTSIYNTKYDDNNGLILLNLTQNNVRGTFPREILLANPDLRWLSLSDNGLFGTISEDIGEITQLGKLLIWVCLSKSSDLSLR